MSSEQKLSSQDKAKLLDHEYDGIYELDYPLPKWWLATFYITIIFAIPYGIYYIWGGGPSLREEHQKNMAVVNQMKEEEIRKASSFDQTYFDDIVKNDGVNKGKMVFETNCVSCHKSGGIGDIGPNLTDSFWIHGNGHPPDLFSVVFNGVEEKGMPVWKEMITKEEIYQAISYVHTLRNLNSKGKPPQGTKIED